MVMLRPALTLDPPPERCQQRFALGTELKEKEGGQPGSHRPSAEKPAITYLHSAQARPTVFILWGP
ncbi:hypothetical protein MC885_021202 [Smutsia gigantea]|nr:hypothetical protein MC885_021202 [Smutsia gigantea]